NDPRFEQFLQGEIPWIKQLGSKRKEGLGKRYKSDWSKAEMINHVLKEHASTRPAASDHRTMLLDNAESIREDFQQALRRVMERYHESTRFIITTRQPSKLIPAIRSRCLEIPLPSPTIEETVTVLRSIADEEDIEYDDDGLEYIAEFADGNLRKAILSVQVTGVKEENISIETAYDALADIGPSERVSEMLKRAEEGEFSEARSVLDDLLYDAGFGGNEIMEEVLSVGRSRYSGESLARFQYLAGEIDEDLATGANDRIHLAHLLAELPNVA
ncbi:MAG: replication factor C small subunit 2, partial [Halobacteriaceae archaeon]